MIIDALSAKLTIPLTFAVVIIYVLRKICKGKGKDKEHFINKINQALRKAHIPLGITQPNWMKIHRVLTVVMLLTLFLHLGEEQSIKHERFNDGYYSNTQNERHFIKFQRR